MHFLIQTLFLLTIDYKSIWMMAYMFLCNKKEHKVQSYSHNFIFISRSYWLKSDARLHVGWYHSFTFGFAKHWDFKIKSTGWIFWKLRNCDVGFHWDSESPVASISLMGRGVGVGEVGRLGNYIQLGKDIKPLKKKWI